MGLHLKTFFLVSFAVLTGVFGAPSKVQVGKKLEFEKDLEKRLAKLKEKYPKIDFDALPDCHRDVTELITSKGYPAETHEVTTDDGYILGLQRIPHGKDQKSSGGGPKQAVLLQHGLEGEASNWVANKASQSLGFILADAGYDVWLGNIRGDLYSTAHTSKVKASEYWKFSWDEMARYDLPAMINYILKVTRNKQIYYVGHSQGTLIAFAEFSQNAEIASKVKTFFALAPVARVGHIKSALKTLAPLTPELNLLLKMLGEQKFLPSDGLLHMFMKDACDSSSDPMKWLCDDIVFLMFGHNAANLNHTRLPVYVCHNPGGTSAQNVAHFGQMVNANKMQKYDYGFLGNMEHYGKAEPPVYNPMMLSTPTVLFHGGKDELADPTDVKWLQTELSFTDKVIGDYSIPEYAHLDFVWAVNAKDKVYSKILSHMQEMDGLEQ